MGGCWKSNENGQTTLLEIPGVGENGAVMITCERWGTGGVPKGQATRASETVSVLGGVRRVIRNDR
ncbi:hypothetical protein ANAPH1_01012 [Anaplasma phagocytophilum]|nr:hypothetical protein ANAPH1_01012 [Anaplasma phagocytophilum]